MLDDLSAGNFALKIEADQRFDGLAGIAEGLHRVGRQKDITDLFAASKYGCRRGLALWSAHTFTSGENTLPHTFSE